MNSEGRCGREGVQMNNSSEALSVVLEWKPILPQKDFRARGQWS